MLAARRARCVFNALLDRRDPHAGADRGHRRREPDLPRGLRRHDLARPDGADGLGRLHAREHGHDAVPAASRRASTLGWDPTLSLFLALVGHDAARAPLRRARRAEHGHLLPDDHADAVGRRLLLRRPGDGRLRASPGSPGSTSTRRRSSATSSTTATASTTSRSGSAIVVYVVIRLAGPDAVRARAAGSPRRAGADELARVRRAAAPDARLRLRRRSSRRSPASCSSGGRDRSHRGTSACQATIDLLIIAVIGGLTRIEGAWVGALAFIVINNYIRDSWLTDLLDKVGIGGSFNTIIGLIFLVIVIVSPDGLMGAWDRLWGLPERRRRRRAERHGDPRRREGVAKGGVSTGCEQGSTSESATSFFP